MKLWDFMLANWLRYYKSSFLSAVLTEIQAELANMKAKVADGNQTALTAYLTGKTILDSYLMGQDGILVKTGMPVAATDIWTSTISIEPPAGQPVILLEVSVDVILPGTGTDVCGYIGIMAKNDLLASPSTLSSMPYYMPITDSKLGNAYSTPTAYTVTSSVLEPTAQNITIPFYGARLGTKGINVYIWNCGVAGASIAAAEITYRSASAL